jgi:hypothetical protein
MNEDNRADMTRGLYRRIYAGFITGRRICEISLQAEAWFWRINAVADDFGNTMADPMLLRNATAGRRGGVTVEQVQELVGELITAGLVILYEAAGESYLHIVDFIERQPGGRNGRRIQRHPTPEEGDSVNPDASKGIPVDPEVSNASRQHHSDSESDSDIAARAAPQAKPERLNASKPKAEPGEVHKLLIAHFADRWATKYGAAYPFKDSRDGAHVKWIREQIKDDLPRGKAIIDAYLECQDKFFADKRHPISLLVSQFQQFITIGGAGHAGGNGRSVTRPVTNGET